MRGGLAWRSGRYGNSTYSHRLVNRSGRRPMVNRRYLRHSGRWGRSPTYYNGRNYHFYLSLYNNHYFGHGHRRWHRRYCGDGLDYYFGWSPISFVLSGWSRSGTYYFEPCYAFSSTFNHGYERGYIDGFKQGTWDWNNYAGYRSYVDGYSGYYSYWGPLSEYIDGYRQGFQQGYYAGYSGQDFGYYNFGFGDFSNYPVLYDFDYDYYSGGTSNASYDGYGYDDDYVYEDQYYDSEYSGSGYYGDEGQRYYSQSEQY